MNRARFKIFLALVLIFTSAFMAVQRAHAVELTIWRIGDLERKLHELVGDKVEVTTWPQGEGGQVFLTYIDEVPSCFVGAEDTVWRIDAGPRSVSGSLMQLFAAGTDNAIHSLLFWFPIVAAGQEEKHIIEVYEDYFAYLFPNWSSARDWPLESLRASWEKTGEAFSSADVSLEEMRFRKKLNDVGLVTFGVPPDFIVYRITSRTECEIIPDIARQKPRPDKLGLDGKR